MINTIVLISWMSATAPVETIYNIKPKDILQTPQEQNINTAQSFIDNNRKAVAEYKSEVTKGKVYYLTHSKDYDGLQLLIDGDFIRVGKKDFKITGKTIKKNNEEAVKFVMQDKSKYMLQTCWSPLDRNSDLVLYDLELINNLGGK